jgi:hypothetical protein
MNRQRKCLEAEMRGLIQKVIGQMEYVMREV